MFKREALFMLALVLAPIVVALVLALFAPTLLRHFGVGAR
jgi:hypothetical protein